MSVKEYLNKRDWRVKENASFSYSLQGLNSYIASEATKKHWLTYFPEEVVQANNDGFIYIHDLGIFGPYCGGHNLEDLLQHGFRGAKDKIHSAPPKRFSTALGQMNNLFFTLSGEFAGAQAFSNFDTLLAPYVWKDELSYEDVEQAMQEFIFALNIPTRIGFQQPFSNLTFDITVPEKYKNKKIIIAGEEYPKTYGEMQHYMDMINKAFCEVMVKGDARGAIFTFPIPTYNITKEFEWDKVPAEIWQMTAKFGTPYFANYVNSEMSASDSLAMCCRLKLNLADIRKRGNGLFSAHPNTGSIGVVTLNLPRIVHYHGLNFDAIKKYAELAKECLEIKRQVIEEQTENGLYPYAQHLLRHAKDCSNTYWGNHFSTIGIIGMHEALLEAGKQGGIVNNMATAEAVLEYIQKLTIDFQKTTGHLYNLEATPAEGCTYTLAKKDKKCGIITSGNKEPYYTNSVHFPVGHEIDMFDMIKQQENIQSMFTGGTVLHLFLGEAIQDPMVVKKLVQRITSESKIPYFSITPTFSVCPEHGYISGEHFNCPDCGAEADVYTRIVGYFRPVKNWNKGKEEEYFERKVYKLGGAE